jgi:hypothetical protein
MSAFMRIFSIAQIGVRQRPEASDLDFPKLENSSVPGIIIHGDNTLAWLFYGSLRRCFNVSKTTNLPDGLQAYYKSPPNEALIWLEIGDDPLWKTPVGC